MSKKNFRADLLTFSLIMGLLSTFLKSVITLVPYYLGLTNNMGILIMGKTIFNITQVPHDPGHLIIASLGHLAFGAILGIGLSIIYLKTGTDFHLIKSGFYGVTIWLIVRNILIAIGIPDEPRPMNVLTAMVSLISHLFYGLTLGYLTVKYNKFIPKVAT
jgi:hypothetical protein